MTPPEKPDREPSDDGPTVADSAIVPDAKSLERRAGRYHCVPLRDSGVAIYDPENTEAYIQSDLSRTLLECE